MKTLQGHELPINIDENALRELCQRWQVQTLEVFGSVLRDDFDPQRSDIDLLVEYLPEAQVSYFDRMQLNEELELLLGRKVDLLPRRAIEQSRNYIRREHILGSVESLYAAP